MKMKQKMVSTFFIVLIGLSVSDCNTGSKKNATEDKRTMAASTPQQDPTSNPESSKVSENESSQKPLKDHPEFKKLSSEELEDLSLEDSVKHLNQRVYVLDSQIEELTNQLKTAQITIKNLLRLKTPEVSGVVEDQTSNVGQKIIPVKEKSDPRTGFSHGPAIQSYRDAKLFFEAEKYPEAILEFSSFVKEYPDHTLASGAQYYIGESYFRQNENQMAHDEFERILVAYDRSAYLPQTLHKLSLTSSRLEEPEKARSYRQLLFSLFPQSPSAYQARKAMDQELEKKAKEQALKINRDELHSLPYSATAPAPKLSIGKVDP